MSRKRQASVWPLVVLVAVLFVLSVLAPREWREVAIIPPVPPPLPARPGLPALAGGVQSGLAAQMLPTRALVYAQQREAPGVRVHDQHDQPGSPLADAPIQPGPMIEVWQPKPLDYQQDLLLSADHIRSLMDERPDDQWQPSDPFGDDVARAFEGMASERRIVEIRPRVTRRYELPSADRFVPAPSSRTDSISVTTATGPRLASRRQLPGNVSSLLTIVERQANDSSGNVITQWPYPRALAAELEKLAQVGDARDWSERVIHTLTILHAQKELASPDVAAALQQLSELMRTGRKHANDAVGTALGASWSRIVLAMKRRLEIWKQVYTIGSDQTISVSAHITDLDHLDHLNDVFAAMERRLATITQAGHWRSYLLLDEAKVRFCQSPNHDSEEGRRLAKRILLRMDYSLLSPKQKTLLAEPEFVDFAVEMRQLAAEPVDYLRLLDVLERYEQTSEATYALHLAAAQLVLRWSQCEHVTELGRRLDANYRNANLRISLSRDFVNRLLPKNVTYSESVDDVILGVPTAGCAETKTRLSLGLVPSPDTWCIELKATGKVTSNTRSWKGPATLYSVGNAVFRAEKQVVVHPYGYLQESANAVADSNAELTDVTTNLDRVPLLGGLVQAVAAQRYGSQSGAAANEVRSRVATEARTRLDEEVNRELEKAARQFLTRFYRPMERLALNPLALQMQTTDKRLIARYRLAAHHQLAAHTPRPIAPADSVLSMQLHESVVNNVAEQLCWESREVNLGDLYGELSELFGLPEMQLPEDFPDDVELHFAAQTPVQITFQDGRMGIQLALDQLKQGRRKWKNFAVRVYYEPARDDPHADLVREQYVELIGRRPIGFRDQIALRGIFSRVFAKTQPISLVTRHLESDPRMAGLIVTQTVIQDGWLGFAVGPAGRRTAAASQSELTATDDLPHSPKIR